MRKYTDKELNELRKKARSNMAAFDELCDYYEDQEMAKRKVKAALRKMKEKENDQKENNL